MTGRVAWIICLGIVGILAVSVAAPTLPTAVSVVDDGTTDSPEPDGEAEELLGDEFGEQPDDGGESPLPVEWLVLGAGLIGLVVLVRVAVVNPEQAALTLGSGVAVVALLGLLFVFEWDVDSGSTASSAPEYFPLLVAAISACLAVAGTALVFSRREDVTPEGAPPTAEFEDRTPTRETSIPPSPSLDVAPGVPIDNDVYRAWWTLTRAVEKRSDDAATPGEIRAAAIDHGFDPDAVAELRRSFEASRYGGREPTADQERRARELLQQLELEGTNGE